MCGGVSVSQSSRTGINVPARGVKRTVPPAADARVLLRVLRSFVHAQSVVLNLPLYYSNRL